MPDDSSGEPAPGAPPTVDEADPAAVGDAPRTPSAGEVAVDAPASAAAGSDRDTPGGREVEPRREPEASDAASSSAGERAPSRRSRVAARLTSRGGRRVAALVGIAALFAITVLVVSSRVRRATQGPPPPGTHGGPAAISAPAGPALPASAAAGVRLTGFVVDGAGLPVAGAEVTAEPEHMLPDRGPAPTPLAPTTPPSGATAGSDAQVAAAGDAAASRAGVRGAPGPGSGIVAGSAAATVVVGLPTGADGRFVLDGLTAGRFRVRVTGAGLLPAELRYVPVPSDEARIVVARQVAIEGIVSDGGKPVPNAQVGLRSDAIGGTIELRSDVRGGFRFANLPEGRYQLFAWQAALAARTVRVSRLGAGPFGPVELRLEAASIVVGRVIDRDEGTGLVAAVELRPSGDDQAPRYARSGDDGVFRIEGIPNGRWIADAFAPGYLSPGGIELEAGRGVPELAMTRGGAIEGRIVDGDGHPIAGATVRSLSAGGSPIETSADVDRDKLRRFSGRTAVARPVSTIGSGGDPELIPRGELGVLAGPIPPIPPPGAHVAETAIAIDPSLAGEPPALPGDPARVSIWTTGSDGVYRIRGLGRTTVSVLAAAAGLAEARSAPVAIAPGQLITGVDVVMTPGTMIVGKVTDQHGAPVIGAQISVTSVTSATVLGAGARDAEGASIDGFTDDAGEYRLGPVAGTVALRATAYGHGEARRMLELAAVRGSLPGERREDLVLVVADAMIAGILEDTTGAAVSGAQLDVVGGPSDGRHTIAAADGTFTLDRLPAGPLRLHIEHPAYPPDDVDAVAGTDSAARLRLRLPLGGGASGAVIDAASAAPISSVTLAAAGPAGALAEASTDKAGLWKLGPLRPGRWHITLKLPGYLAYSRELDVPVAQQPGGTSVRDLRIELARGALVGGTVRDARGQRIAAAHVVVGGAAGLTCEADTDGQGEFRIHDCPTGDLIVEATKAFARGQARATVRPGDEVLSLAIELR